MSLFSGVSENENLEVFRLTMNVSAERLDWLGDIRDRIWRRDERGTPLLLTVQRSEKGILSAFCPVCCPFHRQGSAAGNRAAYCVVKHWGGDVPDEPYLIVG